jgi:phosphinothricin acetyltransferase
MIVRDAAPADLEPMRAIYGWHVLNGLGTFEEVPPDAQDFAGRFAAVAARSLPWLIAEADGRVVGYAYAAPFRTREAYRFSVEDSIYVDPGHTGRGAGRALLSALIERCAAMGLRSMFAVIGDSANTGSIGVHSALGFEPSGVMRSAGFKFGRWVDVVIMRRDLGEGDATPPAGDGWAR